MNDTAPFQRPAGHPARWKFDERRVNGKWVRYPELNLCVECGAFLWYPRPHSTARYYCSTKCLAAAKRRRKERQRNPLAIDLAVTPDPARSRCAWDTCTIMKRLAEAIFINLKMLEADRVLARVEIDRLRVAYLKAADCKTYGARSAETAALVYLATRTLNLGYTQDDVAGASRCCTVTLRKHMKIVITTMAAGHRIITRRKWP